jgi:hypothetical protein
MVTNFRYYDNWKAAFLECPGCWSGIFGDEFGVDYKDDRIQLLCPECDATLANVYYPTKEEVEAAANNGDDGAIEICATVNDAEGHRITQKKLTELIEQEKKSAYLEDRHRGLVYVFALQIGKTCAECRRLADGRVFLLYDGRTDNRHTVPQVPNPFCFHKRQYESEKECSFLWLRINPCTQFLAMAKQYYRSCGEYLDTWTLESKTGREADWKQWIAQQAHLEQYKPPRLIDEVHLTDFEKACIENGSVAILINGRALSVRDLGLLTLVAMMQTVDQVGTGFGLRLQDYGIDFSEAFSRLTHFGKQTLTDFIRTFHYQSTGKKLTKPLKGEVHFFNSMFRVSVSVDITNQALDKILHLTADDIKAISKSGFRTGMGTSVLE